MNERRTGTPGAEVTDQFLSEDDLNLRDLSDEELDAAWCAWFSAAQATNDADADEYGHSAFLAPALWERYGIGRGEK